MRRTLGTPNENAFDNTLATMISLPTAVGFLLMGAMDKVIIPLATSTQNCYKYNSIL